MFDCSLCFYRHFLPALIFAYAWFTIYSSIVIFCSSCFLSMCVFLSSILIIYLKHNHSFAAFFTYFWHTCSWHMWCFYYRNKIEMEILFLFGIFDNDPNNDVVNDSLYVFVLVLFDFVLELTTNCWNKTIQFEYISGWGRENIAPLLS